MSDEPKDQGIFRPLFVMVEAVEAEAKRKLAEQQAAPQRTTYIPPPSMWTLSKLRTIESTFRHHFGDDSLEFSLCALKDAVRLQHRCKVCGRRHWVEVTGMQLMRARDVRTVMDLLLDKLEELHSQPCELELGHG